MIKSLKTLIKGSLIANLITIIISPLITRLYSPHEFGVYTLFITIITLFGPILNMKYDMAIVNSKEKKEEFNLITIAFLIGLFTSVTISIFYSIYVWLVTDIKYYICLTICLFLLIITSINNVLVSINNKQQEYKLMSNVTIIKSLSNSFFSSIFGFLKFSFYGLITAQIISLINGTYKQSEFIRKKFSDFSFVSIREIKENFQKNINFMFFTASAAFLTTSIYSSIILFITYEYDAKELGFYSLGYRILGLPFSIISLNVAKVFYERAVKNKKEFRKTFKETLKVLLFVITPIILAIAIAAPLSFGYIFGSEWRKAGIFILILSPMFFTKLISESLNTTYIVMNKQNLEFYYQIILLISFIILYLLIHNLNVGVYGFLLSVSFMYTIFYSFIIFNMYQLSKQNY